MPTEEIKKAEKKCANDSVSRSWFAVLNNPEEHGFSGTPQEICQSVLDIWTAQNVFNTGTVLYCISANGLHHLHCVFESNKPMRFSKVKRLFDKSIHIEETKGSKAQVEAYIQKKPPFDEKGEQVICQVCKGEVVGAIPKQQLLLQIQEYIAQGLRPEQIMSIGIYFRQQESLIRKAYFAKRYSETPVKREVRVFWHVGEAGSGKSYTYVKLCEEYGEDSVYMYSDCDNGALDRYQAEPILFIDEFKGQMPYERLLRITDVYKTPMHARYSDVYALWTEIHITSVFPPESVYQSMVDVSNQGIDTIQQLLRRLTAVIYHYREAGEYKTFTMAGKDYTSYADLKQKYQAQASKTEGFVSLSEEEAHEVAILFS